MVYEVGFTRLIIYNYIYILYCTSTVNTVDLWEISLCSLYFFNAHCCHNDDALELPTNVEGCLLSLATLRSMAQHFHCLPRLNNWIRRRDSLSKETYCMIIHTFIYYIMDLYGLSVVRVLVPCVTIQGLAGRGRRSHWTAQAGCLQLAGLALSGNVAGLHPQEWQSNHWKLEIWYRYGTDMVHTVYECIWYT